MKIGTAARIACIARFDNLYGLFPGANGIASATPAQYTQVDNDGKALAHLPPVWKGKDPDPAFPKDLPNRPFRIDAPPINLPLSVATRDLVHKFYQNQEQINGGRLDRYVAASDAGALVMGYYDGSKLPLWKWAQEYTLADNFFAAAFGGSYRRVLQAARHPRRAPGLRRCAVRRHAHCRGDRQDQGESALVLDRHHRHLR